MHSIRTYTLPRRSLQHIAVLSLLIPGCVFTLASYGVPEYSNQKVPLVRATVWSLTNGNRYELLNEIMFKQKLEYIHYNPVRAGLCTIAEEYHYSSARFYYDGTNNFGMLKRYSGN